VQLRSALSIITGFCYPNTHYSLFHSFVPHRILPYQVALAKVSANQVGGSCRPELVKFEDNNSEALLDIRR
jgi:hypothetical protein